jgi:hypothetical protein
MPSLLAPLLWLHIGATLAAAGLATACLVKPQSARPARGLEGAIALLAAAALPLAAEGVWWIDMPSRWMVPGVALLALALAAAGAQRAVGRLAALTLAAFFVVLGAASLRNGGPFVGFMAGKAILFGLLMALLPLAGAPRLRMTLLLALLCAGASLGLHRDIPLP